MNNQIWIFGNWKGYKTPFCRLGHNYYYAFKLIIIATLNKSHALLGIFCPCHVSLIHFIKHSGMNFIIMSNQNAKQAKLDGIEYLLT